ncbi:MAG: SpoIIE family protein phosphatase [Planctomycetota bacterium]|jgi:serine phosphatase RsbU (regulator of sigma subunit)/anti-anti-sigma regulatory factor
MAEDGTEGRHRILVVDDEPAVRAVLRRMLRAGTEYEVHEAGDGIEAKGLLEREDIEVVIADLVMPRMDGLALMRWAMESCPGPTWVLLSGQATVDRAIEAIRLGAFDFLRKPLDVSEALLATVRNALRQRKLLAERERLHADLARSNSRLNQQVDQLTRACGILCEQAEIIEDDLRRAERIQKALLPPQPPAAGRLAVNSVYRPSRKVGGDLYDVVQPDARHMVAYLADAAGHGVSAAMLAVLFKQRLGMLDERRHPRNPGAVLNSVNRALLSECAAPGLFITAAYCLIDTETGEGIASSAGHRPLLLRHADGAVEMIYHTGPALGISADARFAQKRFRLGPGDQLLMYTDGLCESAETSRGLTNEQILETMGDGGPGGTDTLERLLKTARVRRNDMPHEDDITMVLLTASTELPSTVDNGPPSSEAAPAPPSTGAPTAQVLVGSTERTSAVSIQGKGTWTFCAAVKDYCTAALKAGRPLTLDMSLCLHLDSTFLGTILETAVLADQLGGFLRIQAVLPEVQALFEELGMEVVLKRVTPAMVPLPSRMTALMGATMCDKRDQRRILYAHEALASLSDRNRAEFAAVIEYVRTQLAESELAAPSEAEASKQT